MEVTKSDILSALWAADIDVDENPPRWGYSGRGMYGKTCFGFVGNDEDYTNFLFTLIENNHEDDAHVSDAIQVAREFSRRMHRDNMGYEYIYYFPGITVLDNE